jgi:hypothetical protein
MNETLVWLEQTALGTAVRESSYLFPAFETVHVLAMAIVVGSIMMVDVRLLNLGWRDRPVPQMLSEVLPWTVGAFLLAAVSGGVLFTSNAVGYMSNGLFLAKGVLLLIIGVNILAIHGGPLRRAAEWAPDYVPAAAKLSGAVSLVGWSIVVVLGRWVGFT